MSKRYLSQSRVKEAQIYNQWWKSLPIRGMQFKLKKKEREIALDPSYSKNRVLSEKPSYSKYRVLSLKKKEIQCYLHKSQLMK